MDVLVHQLVRGRNLATPGNLFDSVDGLREGACEVKQKGANWNRKGTKSDPKGNQNTSTNQDRIKAFP